MKKNVGKLILLLLLLCNFTACADEESNDLSESQNDSVKEENTKEDSHLSVGKLEDMPEISVEGNTVTVVLLQDIPLPYRWGITWQSENATLIEEYEVEDPANGSMFSAGSAEEYHVFVFELAESELVQLEFYNRWVVEPENLAEANGRRNFILEYADGQWKVIVEESSN